MQTAHPDSRLKRLGWIVHALGGGAIVATAVLAEAYLFKPLRTAAVACSGQVAEMGRVICDEERVRATDARLREELEAAHQHAAHLKMRIPNRPRESEFLGHVSRLANEVGLQVRDYRPGRTAAAKSHSTFQVELTCKGDYASICRFLDGLATLPRHSSVTRLEIDAEDASLQYTMKVAVLLYYVVDDLPDAGKKGAENG